MRLLHNPIQAELQMTQAFGNQAVEATPGKEPQSFAMFYEDKGCREW